MGVADPTIGRYNVLCLLKELLQVCTENTAQGDVLEFFYDKHTPIERQLPQSTYNLYLRVVYIKNYILHFMCKCSP